MKKEIFFIQNLSQTCPRIQLTEALFGGYSGPTKCGYGGEVFSSAINFGRDLKNKSCPRIEPTVALFGIFTLSFFLIFLHIYVIQIFKPQAAQCLGA